MKKILLGVFIILFLIVGGYYIWQVSSSQKGDGSSVRIKTAVSFWPGQFWKEIAEEKGWFKEAGLNVELVDANKDYYQSLQDMVDGKIDANDFPPYDFVTYISKGADLVAVINTDSSVGIDAVITSPKITSMQALRGKRVAVPEGTFGEYMLAVALERRGMEPTDIIQVDTQAEKAHEALINGTVDAAVTYEPFITESVQKIGANRVFDTTEIEGLNSSVESFHSTFIKEHPELVQKYVNVWYKTTTFIEENPDEAYAIIAKRNNASIEDVRGLVAGDKILNLYDNKTSFSYAAGYASLHGSFRRLNRFMIDNNIIEKEIDSSKHFNGKFIGNVETTSQ